jgi:hypothetical protein
LSVPVERKNIPVQPQQLNQRFFASVNAYAT